MADIKENEMTSKSSVALTDKLRLVGASDNASYNAVINDIAKAIIQNYTGLSLAGSNQSIKSALDSLNSNLGGFTFKLLTSLPSQSSSELSIVNNTRALLVLLGADANATGIFTISATSGGVIIRTRIGAMSNIADSISANSLSLQNNGGAQINVFAIVFQGALI